MNRMNSYKKTYRFLFACLSIYSLQSTHTIVSCMTTVLNDDAETILIIDHTNIKNKANLQAPGNILFIAKKQSRRFGKAHEHADFTVYTKPTKGQIATATYHVQQKECGKNGKPLLKLSDLKNNTGDALLFTINKINESYSSMVKELPSMQRPDILKAEESNGCSACSRNK